MKKGIITLSAIVLMTSCNNDENSVRVDIPLPKRAEYQDMYSLYTELLFEPLGFTYGPEDWTDEKVAREYSRLHGANYDELLIRRFYQGKKFDHYLIYKLKSSEELAKTP